ncbi:endolysin-like domain-containing protein [Enterocloster lavalensis]|uniref:cell surface protein n=1 Tax=Enterocloster lavalensis TaxID=460384 RepID=UPI000D1B2A8D|nr:cell surface protein [Enterocloster lavalensis]PST31447.1 cell surface protein [Enterocloster lavalensis]
MISNCGHDERGKYSGGQAGDQNGDEWAVIPWYNRPWNYVLRHPDAAVRKKIVELARKAANNDMIGYDQGDRYSFWTQLKAVGYDPSKITVPCESDCSAGVAAIVKAVGYLMGNTKLQSVSIYCYTGNLRAALKAAGFEVLTASKYLASDNYLRAGDVLLYEGHHTAINLDDGASAETTTTYTEGWQRSADGRYWWQRVDGTWPANCWQLINHHWYLFDGGGWMVTGWHRWNGKMVDSADGTGDWYFLDNTLNGPLEGACWHTRDNGAQEIWEVDLADQI